MLSLKKSQGGFSLIEVMIAMVILLIIVFAFTVLFTSSFTGIFRAGSKSESLYQAQANMDNAINSGDIGEVGSLKIPFNGAPDIEEADNQGRIIEIEYEYQDSTGMLRYFLPTP